MLLKHDVLVISNANERDYEMICEGNEGVIHNKTSCFNRQCCFLTLNVSQNVSLNQKLSPHCF